MNPTTHPKVTLLAASMAVALASSAMAPMTLTRERDPRKGTYARAMRLMSDTIVDTDTLRQVSAALSSEQPVARWFGQEVLLHTAEAVDLSRATDGLALLFGHRMGEPPIGRVRNVRLEGGRLLGDLVFARTARADEVWELVKSEFLRDISIGYQISEWKETKGSDRIEVTRWQPFEASVVSVGADHTVGIGREHDEGGLLPAVGFREEEGGDNVVDFSTAIERGRAIGAQDGAKAERTRIAAIHAAFELPAVPRTAEFEALRAFAVEQGWTEARTQAEILRLLGGAGEGAVSLPGADYTRGITHQRAGRVDLVADRSDKWVDGVTNALLVRGGLFNAFDGGKPTDAYRAAMADARQSGFLGMSLKRLAEESLRQAGIDTSRLSDDEVVARAFTLRRSGATTSDFTKVLENVSNKSMLIGWEEAPETWPGLARIGNLSDFKVATRPGLSNFSDLSLVAEDGEITRGTFTDLKETIQLVQYAKKFRITRHVIINDDLNAFAMIPRKMGRGSSRTVGDVFWALVTSNPTLTQDSVALFHTASHANLASSGAAPAVATLNTAYAAMMVQKGPGSIGYLNVQPRFLAAPPGLRGTVLTLLASQKDPVANNLSAENIYYNALTAVIEPRLAANDVDAWYLFADPNIHDTFELGFLNGVQQPYFREEVEWDTRGVEYVVGIDVGGAALDYRGVYKNPGAT